MFKFGECRFSLKTFRILFDFKKYFQSKSDIFELLHIFLISADFQVNIYYLIYHVVQLKENIFGKI